VHAKYEDLLEIGGIPLWFDQNGTPRFSPFTPELTADIYANDLAFMEIACQNCHQKFKVLASPDRFQRDVVYPQKAESPNALLDGADCWNEIGSFHYGDPPRHGNGDETVCPTCGKEYGTIEELEAHRADLQHEAPVRCAAGDTMNSVPVRVLEFWHHDFDQKSPTFLEWVRKPEYEITFTEFKDE